MHPIDKTKRTAAIMDKQSGFGTEKMNKHFQSDCVSWCNGHLSSYIQHLG